MSVFAFFELCAQLPQPSEEYIRYTRQADSLRKMKNYKQAAIQYENAFNAENGVANLVDRYNAACMWSLAGDYDKAFYHLEFLHKYEKVYQVPDTFMIKDTDLFPLHGDPRWQSLLERRRKITAEREAMLNKELVAVLSKVEREDQFYRGKLDSMAKKYGWQSPELKSLWDTIKVKDSLNLGIIKDIIDKHGWPGPDMVGEDGNMTIFLVIQHADQKTQEHYLPLMRQAVKDGKAKARQLALLEDRVAIRQGKKQIYGSQLTSDPNTGKLVLEPIEDEPNVNKRRAAVGLEKLEDYLKHWDIEYKLPKK
jgi:hypothetical protein